MADDRCVHAPGDPGDREPVGELGELVVDEPSGRSPQRDGLLGDLPGDAVLVAVIRDGRTQAPDPDGSLEAGDELLFVTAQTDEKELADVLSPREGGVKDVSLPGIAAPRMATPGL